MADTIDTNEASNKRTKTAKAPDVASPSGGSSQGQTSGGGNSGPSFGDQARSLASEATDVARKVANQGKDKAAEALDGVAKMAEDAAQVVEDRVGPAYGEYARKASGAVKDVADALQSKEIDELIEDTRAFVRRSPAVAIGAAAAVGFLLTRLIKIGSSNDNRA